VEDQKTLKSSKLLAAGAVAALLSACAGGNGSMQALPNQTNQQNAARSIPSRTMAVDGVMVHVLPARGVTVLNEQGAGGLRTVAASGNNLQWYGGPVQTSPKIYIVFWGPKWTTGNGEYTTLTGFFNAIGGHSWINIDTQYSGSNGTVGNPSGQLAGTWIDSSTPPRRPGSSAVGAEAQKAVTHFGYGGVNANYFVAIQSGNDPSGFSTQWCAWHSSESESEGTVSYTDFPYQSDAGANCGAGSVNSPGTYDGVSIVGGHEEAETQTDPQPNSGWLDSSGSEIGDKCAWMNLENNPNAGGYPTQPLWDNKISGCAQSGP
jgi:serine protease